MFFIPMGIWQGAPFGVGYYIWKSLIPTTLGNIVGGGVFVGAVYWYLYLTDEGDVEVDFNMGGMATAMEVGGPMGRQGGQSRGQDATRNSTVPIGEDGRPQVEGHHLPSSSGMMASSIGKELSHEKYTRKRESSSATEEKSSGETV